ncbi:MAG: aldehyde dehydrogenase family protein [Acidobacteria bacterium]|nr:aldehyde dehydrogenase family protein [Acidobacteriota bacterium]
MAEAFGNYINGRWRAASGGATSPSINPADRNDIIGQFAASAAEDAREAIEAAHAALPRWRSLSSFARGEYLRKAADILESRLEEVSRAMVRENGKTILEARGETARAVALFRYYAAEGVRSVGEVVPSVNARTMIYTTRAPLGVVSLVTPWNFPVAIPAWKMGPALVYGNTVVFKPATAAPHCGVLMTQVLEEAGVPAGVVNLLTGSGGKVGEELVRNPLVHGISFTGSNYIGRRIAVWAAERGVKFQLEMGGKNPVIVLPDCDMEQALTLTLRGAFGYAGQKCTATSRAVIHESIYDTFSAKLVERARALKVGPGIEQSTFVPPIITEDQQKNILAAIERGKSEARLLCGGGVPQGEVYRKGYYVEPTVFGDVPVDSALAQEEIFGPVLALMRARNLDEAIDLANRVRYGLSASIFTKDLNAVQEYCARIEAGIVKVNGETAGLEPQVPFGGMKESSSHSREQGRAAMDFFTSIKTVYVDRAGG